MGSEVREGTGKARNWGTGESGNNIGVWITDWGGKGGFPYA